ncbi:BamA/TamA family outer membrane protein [Mesonia sp. K7]|uniref:translocation and assembly module lipoprotein TamL n=1 Tax=Mesonia sp. K7 TaxID=2218606 RepID=UPI000DA84D1C|nr:BamA/TamA family outer membrane protein [Mesonia sp. K7]PZD77614.1 outer membrane protein assembly factor [Mesonia sp. K7]
MKISFTKIALFLFVLMLSGCNAVKRVGDKQHLLTQNTILVNDEKEKSNDVSSLLYQQPNDAPLGFPLKLHIFNLADPNPDSTFTLWLDKKPNRRENLNKIYSNKQVARIRRGYVGLNNGLKKSGEAPVILSEEKTKKSAEKLRAWYWNNGWFNAETDYTIDRGDDKRAQVTYTVKTRTPYIVDSITKRIPDVADSLYAKIEDGSLIKKGKQYRTEDFDNERTRITENFRNQGLYHFEKEFITYEADTINTGHKVNVNLTINKRTVNKTDTTYKVPYKVHTISGVNIFTDYSFENKDRPVTDSIHYDGYVIYGFDEIEFKRKAITDPVFIHKGSVYSDRDRSLTYKRVNELGVFKYPTINYQHDPADTTGTWLIANVFLNQKPKYGFGMDFSVSRSNIQDFGMTVAPSLIIRNVFGGAEILDISARANIGSSNDAAIEDDRFFNISEVGADVSLTMPRIVFPFLGSDKVIPKEMSPFTTFSAGLSTQRNIGLDKQNVTGKYTFRWYPNKQLTHIFNLLDLQYVRNLNAGNYFNVYRNSFDRLNNVAQENMGQVNPDYFEELEPDQEGPPDLLIPSGANGFITDFDNGTYNFTNEDNQQVRNIRERRDRLTENNLIVATSFSYIKSTREGIYDDDFTKFRAKLESAGNSLSLIAPALNLKENSNGGYDLFGVQYSQYLKGELDFINYWDLGRDHIIALRAFGGLAVPYGNSNNIPFARSFYAGGANDNRGWQAFDLGPGSSGGINEFNEANMKLAFSGEYRFNLFGPLHSALFVDIGNIWNIWDNVEDERYVFSGFQDLKELAVSSGIGLRYDLDFFIIRLDVGFKTYNPAFDNQRWFTDYNFKNAVYNVGINYPF